MKIAGVTANGRQETPLTDVAIQFLQGQDGMQATTRPYELPLVEVKSPSSHTHSGAWAVRARLFSGHEQDPTQHHCRMYDRWRAHTLRLTAVVVTSLRACRWRTAALAEGMATRAAPVMLEDWRTWRLMAFSSPLGFR